MTFYYVSQAQVDALQVSLGENHTLVTESKTVNSDNFIIEGHGIKVSANYNIPSKELDVQILHKPLFVSEKMVENGIREALASKQ